MLLTRPGTSDLRPGLLQLAAHELAHPVGRAQGEHASGWPEGGIPRHRQFERLRFVAGLDALPRRTSPALRDQLEHLLRRDQDLDRQRRPRRRPAAGDPRIADGTIDMGFDEFHPRLYQTGDPTPGGNIGLRLIGLPKHPAMLYVAADCLSRPQPTKYGLWHLEPPLLTIDLGLMPWMGMLKVEKRIPPDCPVPLVLPMQGWVRDLTNLEVMEIEE